MALAFVDGQRVARRPSLLKGVGSLLVGRHDRAGRHRRTDRAAAAHLRHRRRCSTASTSSSSSSALFAVGEAFVAWRRRRGRRRRSSPLRGRRGAEPRRTGHGRGQPWLRGTAIGFPIGALPAGGAEIPTFLSYAVEKRLTKHPEEFGHRRHRGRGRPRGGEQQAATGAHDPRRSRSGCPSRPPPRCCLSGMLLS